MGHTERLKISLGLTVNLGNYESARIDMSIERDFPQVTDQIVRNEFDHLKGLVEEAENKLDWKNNED